MATKSSGDKMQHQQEKLQASGVMVDSGGFSTDDDGEQINIEKLRAIRKMAAQKQQMQMHQQEQVKQQQVDNNLNCEDRLIEHVTESSAVTIQKMWRGYHTRKKTNKDIAERLQRRRTQEYIE